MRHPWNAWKRADSYELIRELFWIILVKRLTHFGGHIKSINLYYIISWKTKTTTTTATTFKRSEKQRIYTNRLFVQDVVYMWICELFSIAIDGSCVLRSTLHSTDMAIINHIFYLNISAEIARINLNLWARMRLLRFNRNQKPDRKEEKKSIE